MSLDILHTCASEPGKPCRIRRRRSPRIQLPIAKKRAGAIAPVENYTAGKVCETPRRISTANQLSACRNMSSRNRNRDTDKVYTLCPATGNTVNVISAVFYVNVASRLLLKANPMDCRNRTSVDTDAIAAVLEIAPDDSLLKCVII